MKRSTKRLKSDKFRFKKSEHQTYPISMYIWYIIYPLCIYHIILISVMFFAGIILGTDVEAYMKCQILGTLATIPVMYMSFYRMNDTVIRTWGIPEKLNAVMNVEGNKFLQRQGRQKTKLGNNWNRAGRISIRCCIIIVIAGCIGIGFGNLLTMSPLAMLSKGFSEANEHFYGSTLVIEIVGAGILTPILEELLYRGIIYERLRFFMNKRVWAVVIASLIFAMVHVNLVQFIFAFGMGIVLAMCMEITGHVYGAVIAHMTSNLLAIIRTECGLWQKIGDGSLFAWLVSFILLCVGVTLLMITLVLQKRNALSV